MASKPASVVDSETLKCSVCKESNPDKSELTLLPCEHRLCGHCTQLVSASAATASPGAKCPSCIARPEVSGDAEKAVLPPRDDCRPPPVCANTTGEHGPVSVFCSDCNKFYCEGCSKNHDLFDFMKGHDIKPISEMSFEAVNEASSSVCPEHELSKNIWCKKCHRLMCPTCGLFEHKDHLVQKLTDALSEAQKKLDSVIAEAEDYILKQDQNLAEMDQTEREIKANIQSARKAVEKAAQKLRDIITEHERDLVSDLDRSETQVLSKLKTMYEESRIKKLSAEALEKKAESLYQTKKRVYKIEEAATLQEKFGVLKKTKIERPRWDFALRQSQHPEEQTKATFGMVDLRSQVAANQTSLGEPLEILRSAFQIKSNGIVTGVVVIGNWLCLTHFSSTQLHLYDMVTHQKKSNSVPNLNAVRGMAWVKTKNTLALTDEEAGGGCKLHLVRLSEDMAIADHHVKNIPIRQPRRITFSQSTGELLIGGLGSPQFVVCTEEGELIKQVTISRDGRGRGADAASPVCVLDLGGSYSILTWDAALRGTLRWVTQQGTNDGILKERLKRPRHFVGSKDGALIVADSENDRVLLIEGKEEPIISLVTSEDGLHTPDCLYLDEEAGRLFVAAHNPEGSVEIRLYRWPPFKFFTTDFTLNVSLKRIS